MEKINNLINEATYYLILGHIIVSTNYNNNDYITISSKVLYDLHDQLIDSTIIDLESNIKESVELLSKEKKILKNCNDKYRPSDKTKEDCGNQSLYYTSEANRLLENANFLITKTSLSNLKHKVNNFEDNIIPKVNNIHTQILSIMAILIAAFSIIGFNFTAIKTVIEKGKELSVWEYISAIGVINLSIALTLYFLFYLVSKITNSKKKIFSPKVAVVAIVALVIMVFVPLIIESIS